MFKQRNQHVTAWNCTKLIKFTLATDTEKFLGGTKLEHSTKIEYMLTITIRIKCGVSRLERLAFRSALIKADCC